MRSERSREGSGIGRPGGTVWERRGHCDARGSVDGEGGHTWGGANGTQFWIDRQNNVLALFMVQTQHYRAPTHGAFRALVHDAAGIGRGRYGRSWFTAQAGDDEDPDTSIWLLGFNAVGKHIVRRLDGGASTGLNARRLDPKSHVSASELFVHYTVVGGSRSELRLCRAGITPSTPSETPR